jgi:hypothetical protein
MPRDSDDRNQKEQEDRDFWDKHTGPFFVDDETGTQPAPLELRQVRNDEFELLKPFRFIDPDAGSTVAVTGKLLGRTDVASIPTFLGWFARRHGRHTFAALMHDQLITDSTPPADRVAADLLFRYALIHSKVPPARAWLLWTAVTLATRWSMRLASRASIVLWFIAALTGTALFAIGILTASATFVAVAALAPLVFSALWGRQWRAGVVAGYAFWLAVAGSLPAYLAYQVYRGVEWVALRLWRLSRKDIEVEPPPSFGER